MPIITHKLDLFEQKRLKIETKIISNSKFCGCTDTDLFDLAYKFSTNLTLPEDELIHEA